MRQIQRDIWEIKTFIQNWKNLLNESENRIEDLRDKITAGDLVKQDILKISRDHKNIPIPEKYNIWFTRDNEKAEVSTNDIKKVYGSNDRKLPRYRKIIPLTHN